MYDTTKQAPSPIDHQEEAAAHTTSRRREIDLRFDKLLKTTLTSCGRDLNAYFDKKIAAIHDLSSMSVDISDELFPTRWGAMARYLSPAKFIYPMTQWLTRPPRPAGRSRRLRTSS